MSTTDNTETGAMDVIKNEALERFEIHIGDEVAFLRYEEEPGRIHLIHTEVPEKLSGQGIGGKLAAFALDHARARGLGVLPACPYVRAYIERHPEYADLVSAT
jgi:predicted GNAT family acetyltransferase